MNYERDSCWFIDFVTTSVDVSMTSNHVSGHVIKRRGPVKPALAGAARAMWMDLDWWASVPVNEFAEIQSYAVSGEINTLLIEEVAS